MKKILTLLMTICFILPCTFIFASCGSNLDALDGSMANLSNYESIGLGDTATLSNETGAIANNKSATFASNGKNLVHAADKHKHHKYALVGADKHGKVDKVSFKNGNKDVVPDNLYVSSFNKTKRYIIITYTDLDNSSSGQNDKLRTGIQGKTPPSCRENRFPH